MKYVPVFGFLVGAIPAITTAAGITYAIGKVFIQHFELGGALLDFDAAKTRAYHNPVLHQGPFMPSSV